MTDSMANNGSVGKAPQTARHTWSRWLAVCGLICLSYLAGAAVVVLDLPSADFLKKAFSGAKALNDRVQASKEPAPSRPAREIDDPLKTFDGFTLYTYASPGEPADDILLVNMRREVVHRWKVSFREIWPEPRHLGGRVGQACVFSCYLYPNGDLLAIFHGLDHSAIGYGLAKLDKNSRLIWKHDASVHHDVDVGEDGTIYTLTQALVNERPKGMEAVPPPWLVDYLVTLAPDGHELRPPLPILDALLGSYYAPLFSSLEVFHEKGMVPTSDEAWQRQDVLHTNSVCVLTSRLAAKFPSLKAGQVLISIRNLDALAVLDLSKRSVVWATRGPWRAQHDARFLENGHLLVFDNRGSPRGSRVLEFDPQTHAFPWTYPPPDGPTFYTSERGMSQRLPNGNTLIVNSEGRELLEVTPGKQVVWCCATPGFGCTARRYSPDQVPFLAGGVHARPR
jgi:hypothetical protein